MSPKGMMRAAGVMAALLAAEASAAAPAACGSSVRSFCRRAEAGERLARDVLAYRPDLVFLDWTVNDDMRCSNDDASASYEGILRGLLAHLPDCVPVPVILPDRRTVTAATEADFPRRAEHLAVARAFNLAWLVWPIGAAFDPSVEHELEIRGRFRLGAGRELRLGSICVAGRDAAEVKFER